MGPRGLREDESGSNTDGIVDGFLSKFDPSEYDLDDLFGYFNYLTESRFSFLIEGMSKQDNSLANF